MDNNSNYLRKLGKWTDNHQNIGHGYIIKNCIAFLLKVTPESSGKSITNFIHK